MDGREEYVLMIMVFFFQEVYVLLLLDVLVMKIPFLLMFYVSTPNYCVVYTYFT